MKPPASKILCPGCRAAFDADTNFCSRCGADLHAPPAEAAARTSKPVPAAAAAPAGEPPRDPLIGKVVDGRYRVLERIGSGGMGIVYRVEHQRMGKIAAMKVLRRDLAANREVVKRFRREAQAVSRLTHANTVQVFDFGTSDGAMYLVMEYVRGEDVRTLVRREGPLPPARAASIFIQVCGALDEAHELGIVHRDLKPDNILVTHGKDGHDHAKVLDFGLAHLPMPEGAPDATERGEILGTPYYMAPEQIRGDPLDQRADVYSLGAVLYFALTGEPPFQAKSTIGILTKHLTDPVQPPSARRPDGRISPHMDAVILRAMAKKHEERFASAAELRDALAAAEPEAPRVAARAPRASESPPPASLRGHLVREDFDAFERSLRRRAWIRTLIVPLAVAGLAAGGLAYLRHARGQPKSVEVEPNNDLATATPIAAGLAVRGKIGQRLAADQGDRDYFRLETGATPKAPRTLAAEVSAIPNIDLTLAVFDDRGRLLKVADAHPVGEGEALAGVRVTTTVVYLAVVEKKPQSARVPTENLSDEYALAVTLK